MRPKKDTYIFSVAERILLCLREHHSVKKYDIPPELTQRGIGPLLNIRKENVSRYLIGLCNRGYIQRSKGRPRRSRVSLHYYLLTESGYQQATKLLERAAETKINLVFPSREVITNLYDAPSLIPGKPSLTELITATRKKSLDIANFIGERARRGGGIYKASPEMPTVEHFYGRNEELKRISEWYRSKTERILSVVGVAGIGKTTLLAHAAQDWVQDRNVFWYKLREYDTPWSVAHAISIFLSSVENRPISSAISERDVDIGLLSYILSEEVKGIEVVFVFDDIHKASEEALTVIKAITDIVLCHKKMKMATASRKYVKMVDRRIYMDGAQADMKIDGLDPSAAAYLLPRGLSEEKDLAGSLIRKTGGHPLLIKSALLGIAGDFGFLRYIQDEIVAGISETEREVLRLLALFRIPVKKADLCNLNVKIDDIESLDDRGLIAMGEVDDCEIHEVIKEFMVSRMGKDERKSLNKKIAETYSSLPGELFAVESIYHYAEAGDYEGGAALLIDFGDPIVTFGMAPRIAAQAKRIAENYRPVPIFAAKYFRILGDVFEQSGEWDDASDAYRAAGASDDAEEAALALTRLMGIYYRKGLLDAARKTVRRAVKIAERSGSAVVTGEAQYSLGSLAFEMRDISEAERAYKNAIDISRRSMNLKLMAQATYGLGRIEHAQGHLMQAIKTKEKAAALFEQITANVELCKVLTSIGKSYFAIGDSKTALAYHEKAVKMCEEVGNVRLLAYALSNAGGVLIKIPNYERAEQYLTRALQIIDRLGEKKRIASFSQNLSLFYIQKGLPEKALPFAERGREIAVELGVPADIAKADAFLVDVLLALKRYPEAKKYIHSALTYAKRSRDVKLKREMERDLKFIDRN
ncbi:MAG: tetratricopeptide repeat protein [Euryarchaeota archaeon]|nr:tetratricopeptide repeat protein [Euryarchaeota archaeon]